MSEYYDDRYRENKNYWGKQPSSMARIFFQRFPPTEGQALIEIGSGQGRDSIFFAQNGCLVTSFDFSMEGVKKAIARASELNLSIDFFQADINEYRLKKPYDVVFASGALHYIPQNLRVEIISNYKQFTVPGGIHAFMVPVDKSFIPKNPQDDPLEQDWISGEILTYYHDWKIEFFSEEIQDDGQTGYKWAFNRMIAREPSNFE